MPHPSRTEIGQHLSHALVSYADRSNVLIMATTTAGAAIGYELHRELHLPMVVMEGPYFGLPQLEDKTVILVDDGMTNHETINMVLGSLKIMGCLDIIMAVPVLLQDTAQAMAGVVNGICCVALQDRMLH